MKPIVFTPFFAMCVMSARGDEVVVLRRLEHPALLRVQRLDHVEVPTVAISGTFASAITSRIASAFGVVDGPISASILFSWTSFLTFCTARVVSPPSSSWMYSIGRIADRLRQESPVFFCGMPIAVVGPVADTMRPILTWAAAERTRTRPATSSERDAHAK